MTQQNLTSMNSNVGISFEERRHRLLCWIRGAANFGQAVKGFASLSPDLDKIEKGIEEWKKAFTSRRIRQNDWYEDIQTLIYSRLLVHHNPEKLEQFEDCFTKVDVIQKGTENEEQQKALRFAMIDQVAHLALECNDEPARQGALVQLGYFGRCCEPTIGWSQDSDILEALVEAAPLVRQKEEFRERMDILLNKISFHVGSEEFNEMKAQLGDRVGWNERSNEVSTSYLLLGAGSLFNAVKARLSLDASTSAQKEVESMGSSPLPQPNNEQPHSCNDPANCPPGIDTTGEPETTDFWAENMYRPNLKHTLCLQFEGFVRREGRDGYLKAKGYIDDRMPALCYCQHILLSLEHLEASLSAAKQEDRKAILDCANVFEDAIELIKNILCDKFNLQYSPLAWVKHAVGIGSIRHDVWLLNELRQDLFAKVVKVGHCFPEQWDKIKGILDPHAFETGSYLAMDCILSVMRANPDAADNRQKSSQPIHTYEGKPSNVSLSQYVAKFTTVAWTSWIPRCGEYVSKRKATLLENLPKWYTSNETLSENVAKYRLKFIEAMQESGNEITQLFLGAQQTAEQARDSMALVSSITPQSQDGLFRRVINWAWDRIPEWSVVKTAEKSLDQLLEEFIEGPDEGLISFIVPKLFSTPVTMHGLEDQGRSKLIIQRESSSGNEYTFKSDEDAKTFLSAIKKHTQQQFPRIATLMLEKDKSNTH